ncbi:DedA family protein [Kitasatospora sp. NPDC058965]|uniref:DedA family protein n=1 Tax=Kitasatospora sp. NPDC058965 TaxID=3346682 RepID=UPI0036BF9DB8
MGSAALVTAAGFSALAVLAVLGDAFLPFLPSGTLVVLAVLKSAKVTGAPLVLAVAVALASFLGDLLLLKLARRGAPFLRRRLARRPQLAASVRRVQQALDGRTTRTAATLVIVARFVPGGRTVLDLAVGHLPHRSRSFLQWSAVSSLIWAGYIVTLGWLDLHVFSTAWLSLAVSSLAATAVSAVVARVVRRHRRLSVVAPLAEQTAPAPLGDAA